MSNTNLQTLAQKVKALSAKSSTSFLKDSNGYYQVTTDSTGNGNTIIRFLPALPDEELPFIQIYNHAFQGPTGKWFIEPCASTIGQACPVCEANRSLLCGGESQKKIASARKRKMNYVSNVLVIKDAKAPEKEGKAFLFKFGVKIMDKIKDMIAPPFNDAEPVDPFDTETGANFRLRVVKTGNFPDYSKSEFDKPTPLGDEKMVETVLKQRRSLAELISPQQFKTYDDLKAKFQQIIGEQAAA